MDSQDERLVLLWRDITSSVQRTRRGIGQAMDESGVSVQDFAVLNFLLHSDDHQAPMNVLAREVSMTSGGFTKLADRMARDGLIDRRGSDSDRRVIRVVLTPEGEQRVREAAEKYVIILRTHLLATLSMSEMAAVAGSLTKLIPVEVDHVGATEQFLAAPRNPAQPERRARPAQS